MLGAAWPLFLRRGGGHVNDQRAFWRIKPLTVDLNDSIAIFLIELKDPTVEIVAFVRDIGRVDAG